MRSKNPLALRTVLVLTGALGAAPLYAADYADAVVSDRGGGKTEVTRGQVIRDGIKDGEEDVQVQVPSGPQFRVRGRVVEIRWDPSSVSPEWFRGVREMGEGNYAAAAESFRMVYEDLRNLRALVRPDLLARYGECLYRTGDGVRGIEVLGKLVDEYPASRQAPKGVERLVDLCIQTKNYNKAVGLLDKLKAVDPERAALYQADLAMAREQPDEALKAYTALQRSKDPDTVSLARMGLARCHVLKGNLQAARELAQQSLDGNPTNVAAAAAWMIIGDALLDEAKKAVGDEAKDKFRDAALAFLRIPLKYKVERLEPEALFKAGECFRFLSRKQALEENLRRAQVMYAEVRERFTGSRWASEADKASKLR